MYSLQIGQFPLARYLRKTNGAPTARSKNNGAVIGQSGTTIARKIKKADKPIPAKSLADKLNNPNFFNGVLFE